MTNTELNKGTNYLLKNAESGFFGRYFNMDSLPNQAALESDPGKTVALRLPASAASKINPLAGMLVGSPIEMAVRRMALGGTTHERKSRLDEADKTLRASSYGENIGKMIGNTALPMGIAGAGIGGLAGGLMSGYNSDTDTGGDLMSVLKNVGIGAGIGGLGGLAGSALGGTVAGAGQKFISNNTSKESKERAKAMVAKHPYATALPFGGLIGAMRA